MKFRVRLLEPANRGPIVVRNGFQGDNKQRAEPRTLGPCSAIPREAAVRGAGRAWERSKAHAGSLLGADPERRGPEGQTPVLHHLVPPGGRPGMQLAAEAAAA